MKHVASGFSAAGVSLVATKTVYAAHRPVYNVGFRVLLLRPTTLARRR